MKANNIAREKSFSFTLDVIEIYRILTSRKEFVLSKQLLRSGTSIGANIRESEHAESRADFIHKLSISLKEANETDYWIDLLSKSSFISQEEFLKLKNAISEILRLLISIINSSKQK